MELFDWQHKVVDLADYPEELVKEKESILANSVNVANYRFLKKVKPHYKILEIGCGCSSFIRDNMVNKKNWSGIDVYDFDSRGRPCIATHKASVHNTPFSNNSFDYVISNQSIEHWSEYGVKLAAGLCEIWRVLKVNGQAYLNFPFYLHGDPLFVQGNLIGIMKEIPSDIWKIREVVAFKNSNEGNYKGWQRCGFPDFYVNQKGFVPSSFVVELVIEKRNCDEELFEAIKLLNPKVKLKKKTALQRAYRHGIKYLVWRIISKFYKR